MPILGNLENKIITSSVAMQTKPVEALPRDVKPLLKEETKTSSNHTTLWLGAAAVASLAIAGIAIAHGRKAKPSSVDNPFLQKPKSPVNTSKKPKVEPQKPVNPENINNKNTPNAETSVKKQPETEIVNQPFIINKLIEFSEEAEKLRLEAEGKIRGSISGFYKAFKKGGMDSMNFNHRAQIVVRESDKHPAADLRLLSKEECKVVTSYQRNYQYNAKLRSGADLSDVEDIKVLDRLIQDAVPLEEDAYVYRGIRTQKIWDDFSELDFAKDLAEGNILEDKAFVSTARVYGDLLAQVDPHNFSGHNTSGYVMRIKLPKGTKGLDCRRSIGRDLDGGYNAEFILPRNSQFKIVSIDKKQRIMECEYILPAA